MDPPPKLTVSVAGQEQLVLPGAGSVGYTWTYDVDGPPAVVALTFAPETGPPKVTGGLPQGGSVRQVLTIRGLAPGQVSLHLKLQRPGETERPPRDSYDIQVTVR